MTLVQEIAEAEEKLKILKQRALTATCIELGHDWQSTGGKSAGCCDTCQCSVPVNVCKRCGDCDYGDNEWADKTRDDCFDKLGPPEDRYPEPVPDYGDINVPET